MKSLLVLLGISLFFNTNLYAKQEVLFDKSLNGGSISFSVTKNQGKYYFYYNGGIPLPIIFPTFSSFEYFNAMNKALNTIPDNTDFTMVLESPGGYTVSVFQLALVLEKKCPSNKNGYNLFLSKKDCKITSYVAKDKMCASACIAFFMLGQKRIAHEKANFGFHAMTQRLSSEPSNAESESSYNIEEVEAANGEVVRFRIMPSLAMIDFYSHYGIDRDWLLELEEKEEAFNKIALTVLNPIDLDGSNMIDQIYYD